MTYKAVLPQLFPYCAEMPVEEVEKAITYLLPARGVISGGSSFAVTADSIRIGYRNLWLSQISWDTLKVLGEL